MEAVVYGKGDAPRYVERLMTMRAWSQEELYGMVYNLSGSEFLLIIFDPRYQRLALNAANIGWPKPTVLLARDGRLREVVGIGQFQGYPLRSRRRHRPGR